MKLSSLIRSNSWLNVAPVLTALYPDEEENLEGYEVVFKSLLLLAPITSSMSIVVKEVKDDYDDEEYVDVSGIDSTDEEMQSWAIEFRPWEEWLDMEIHESSVAHFTEAELIAHCLHEMTFMGFEQEEIKAQLEELNQQVEEIKNMTDEEKKEKFISLDELKQKLGDEDEPEDQK